MMKDLNLEMIETHIRCKEFNVNNIDELSEFIKENFSSPFDVVFESPKQCKLDENQCELTVPNDVTYMTVCNSKGEIRAEKSSEGFSVRLLTEVPEGFAVIYRQLDCYMNVSEKKITFEKF